jgi:hypothetical protein
MEAMVVTEEVFHPAMSAEAIAEHPSNMEAMVVTPPVPQP